MQKLNFEEPKLTAVVFQAEDVITTSITTGEGSGSSRSFVGDGDNLV